MAQSQRGDYFGYNQPNIIGLRRNGNSQQACSFALRLEFSRLQRRWKKTEPSWREIDIAAAKRSGQAANDRKLALG